MNNEIMAGVDVFAQIGLLDEDDPIKLRVELAYEKTYDPAENRTPTFLEIKNEFQALFSPEMGDYPAYIRSVATDEKIKSALDELRLCYSEDGAIYNSPQRDLFWRII